jgi:hypothetical protein
MPHLPRPPISSFIPSIHEVKAWQIGFIHYKGVIPSVLLRSLVANSVGAASHHAKLSCLLEQGDMQNLFAIFAFFTVNGGCKVYHPGVGWDNRR